jgi:hypothetical protein
MNKQINKIYFGFKIKTCGVLKRALNRFEIMWRKETIRILEKKLDSGTTDEDVTELSERLKYEKEMLSTAESDKYINNVQDLFEKMVDKKWY